MNKGLCIHAAAEFVSPRNHVSRKLGVFYNCFSLNMCVCVEGNGTYGIVGLLLCAFILFKE